MTGPVRAVAGRLPCGRDPMVVADRAVSGRSDEHERGCPWCQEAIALSRASARGAAELGRADRDVPVPETLLPSVMRSVWSELRPTMPIPLPTGSGPASVTDRVAGSLVDRALAAVDGLVVHTVAVELAAPGAQDGPVLAVRIRGAGEYGSDLEAVAAHARAAVVAAVARQLGLRTGAVDLEIVDVYVVPDGER